MRFSSFFLSVFVFSAPTLFLSFPFLPTFPPSVAYVLMCIWFGMVRRSAYVRAYVRRNEGRMEGWMEGWMDGWMDGWDGPCVFILATAFRACMPCRVMVGIEVFRYLCIYVSMYLGWVSYPKIRDCTVWDLK